MIDENKQLESLTSLLDFMLQCFQTGKYDDLAVYIESVKNDIDNIPQKRLEMFIGG